MDQMSTAVDINGRDALRSKMQSVKSSFQAWKCVSFAYSLLALILISSKLHEVSTDLRLLLGIDQLLAHQQNQQQQQLAANAQQLNSNNTNRSSSSVGANESLMSNFGVINSTSGDEEPSNSRTAAALPLELLLLMSAGAETTTNGTSTSTSSVVDAVEALADSNEQPIGNSTTTGTGSVQLLMSHMQMSLGQELGGIELLRKEVETFSVEFKGAKSTLSLSAILIGVYILSWFFMTLAINDTRISNDISLRNILLLSVFGIIDSAASLGFVFIRLIMFNVKNKHFMADLLGSSLKNAPVRLNADQLTAFTALRLIALRSSSAYIDIYVAVLVIVLTLLRVHAILRGLAYYRFLRRMGALLNDLEPGRRQLGQLFRLPSNANAAEPRHMNPLTGTGSKWLASEAQAAAELHNQHMAAIDRMHLSPRAATNGLRHPETSSSAYSRQYSAGEIATAAANAGTDTTTTSLTTSIPSSASNEARFALDLQQQQQHLQQVSTASGLEAEVQVLPPPANVGAQIQQQQQHHKSQQAKPLVVLSSANGQLNKHHSASELYLQHNYHPNTINNNNNNNSLQWPATKTNDHALRQRLRANFIDKRLATGDSAPPEVVLVNGRAHRLVAPGNAIDKLDAGFESEPVGVGGAGNLNIGSGRRSADLVAGHVWLPDADLEPISLHPNLEAPSGGGVARAQQQQPQQPRQHYTLLSAGQLEKLSRKLIAAGSGATSLMHHTKAGSGEQVQSKQQQQQQHHRYKVLAHYKPMAAEPRLSAAAAAAGAGQLAASGVSRRRRQAAAAAAMAAAAVADSISSAGGSSSDSDTMPAGSATGGPLRHLDELVGVVPLADSQQRRQSRHANGRLQASTPINRELLLEKYYYA